MSRSIRVLRVLVGLAALVLLANLGVLLWLNNTPLADLSQKPEYDVGPGEQPTRH